MLVAERTPEALALVIIDAVRNPEKMQRLAQQAHQEWQRRFTLDRFQTEVCQLLEDILDRRHQRAPLRSEDTKARV